MIQASRTPLLAATVAVMGVVGATVTLAQGTEPTHPIDLDAAEYTASPFNPAIATSALFGSNQRLGLYATHARVGDGAVVPPHVHDVTLTTMVTSGTAYVGTGESFDESALVAYPSGTYFITPAGSPHFIKAADGEFTILDHGVGPVTTTIIK